MADNDKDKKDEKDVIVFQCFPTKGRCDPADHDWQVDEDGQVTDNSVCMKCGMSFIAHIHMEMP